MAEPKSDATRMGLVATLAVLSLACFMASGLMWLGTFLPEEVVWLVMLTAGAAFVSAFLLGTILAIIGARKRSRMLLEGEELDARGAELGVEREEGERDSTYRHRIQHHSVTRDGSG